MCKKLICYGNGIADCCCASTGNSGSLEVQVQHLQFLHHPMCLRHIAGVMSLAATDTQVVRLSQATNGLPGRHAQMLTQAQHALKQSLLPSISVQVHVILFRACLCRKGTHCRCKALKRLLSCQLVHNQKPNFLPETCINGNSTCGQGFVHRHGFLAVIHLCNQSHS